MKEFEELYKEIFKSVFYYIYTLSNDYALAEDITQDTFLKAYEYLIVKGKPLTKSWFYTVARNQYISLMRKRKFMYQTGDNKELDELLNQIPDKGDTPEELVLKKERQENVTKVLNEMNESYKTALILREYHGLSFDEISDILGVKRTYGKQLLYKAREKFKTLYGGKVNE